MHEALLFPPRPPAAVGLVASSTDNDQHDLDEETVSLGLTEDRIKKRRPFPLLLFTLGIFLVLLGTAAPKRLDQAVDDAVWKQMRMDVVTTRGFREFAKKVVHPTQASVNGSAEEEGDSIYLRFHLFHVINPNKKDPKSKYRIEERGPYVYRVYLQHFNVSFFGEDTGDYERSRVKEVYYKTWQQVFHVVGGPHGGRDDSELLTTVSMPYQAILAISKQLPSKALQNLVLDHFLGNNEKDRRDKVFVRKSVREILFGYHETFRPKSSSHYESTEEYPLEFPPELKDRLNSIIRPYSSRLGSLIFSSTVDQLGRSESGITFPGFVQNFSSQAEADAKTEFDAQRVDRAMTGTYVWYQGSSQLRRCPKDTCPLLWGSREANRVLGSNSKFWGGKDHKENVVFLSPITRTAKLVLDETLPNGGSVIVDGIKCKRWTLHPSVFGNVTDDATNEAYYAVNQPSGILNISPLLLNIPIYASKPRFLHGDRETLLASVEGMPDPDPAINDITFDVHEETGISVLVSERFQYSVRLEDGALMPVFWFETIETMSTRHTKLFRKCDSYVKAAAVFRVVGMVLGIICLVLGVYIGTDRAEQDARRAQAKAVYDDEHYHHRHSASVGALGDNVDDDDGDDLLRRRRQKGFHGVLLILSSKSLKDAWMTTPPFVFMVNLIIEMITLRKSKHVSIWNSYEHGESSAALQVVLTALFVGIFVSISGVAVARAAFIRGEVPRRLVPFEPFTRKRCWTRPWLATDHACGLGVLVGLTFMVLWAGPVLLLTYLFLCGSSFSQDECTLFWMTFVLFKCVFAAIEALIVFPLAALRALHGSYNTRIEEAGGEDAVMIPLEI